MLCLLPFEVDIYRQAGIDAVCVGHPLVDELTKLASVSETRQQLELPSGCTILGILPGSRESEVRYLMPHFVEAMAELHRRHPELHFVVPAANENRRAEIDALLGCHDLPVTVALGRGREAMRASDALLIASGTATLEAMLLRKPMVISYRMAAASWAVLSRMVKTPYVGLPNILAGQAVAPELLQTEANAGRMVHEVSNLLESGGAQQVACFNELAERIGGNFAARSIDAPHPVGRLIVQADDLSLGEPSQIVAGVDEVGRGPLAGDVVAAAVILSDPAPAGITDSKALTAKRRRCLADVIRNESVSWALGRASVAEIDELNILEASLLAMRRAVEGLSVTPNAGIG